MKQDVKKIKEAIKAASKLEPAGLFDHKLYATYLYAVRSHARGRIHMKTWNKAHPKEMKLPPSQYWIEHPLTAGRVEFSTLDQQAAWIAYVRAFIEGRQNSSSTNDWKKLILDFDAAEEPVVTSVAQ
jgi:hypothetical protein